MKHIELFNIKLNHIRIFLSVVEYGSFTIAAEKLHLTQPYVSKTIVHLEEELDLYLFIRGNRKFQVTPAGRILYLEWKHMMEDFENTLEHAHSVQEGLSDSMMIGLGELTDEEGIIVQNLQQLRTQFPGVNVHIEYEDMSAIIDSLIQGKVDMAVLSKHMLPMIDQGRFDWKTLIESNLSVYVHKSSLLYQREKIEFKDFKDERFIVFSSEKDDSYLRLLQHLGEEAGFVPRISCYVQSEISFKVNLKMGNGVVLADSASHLEDEDIRRVDLDMRNDVIAIWKKDNCRECMQYYLSLFA